MWEVYGRKSGNIVRSSYSSSGNVEDEFLFENPVVHNQKNYKQWKKSLTDIEKEVEAIVRPPVTMGGELDPTTGGQYYTGEPVETQAQAVARIAGSQPLDPTKVFGSTDPFPQPEQDPLISLDPIADVKKAIETIASIPEVVKQAPAELQQIIQTRAPQAETYIGPPSEVEDLLMTAGPYQPPPSDDTILKAGVPDLTKIKIPGVDWSQEKVVRETIDYFFSLNVQERHEWLKNIGETHSNIIKQIQGMEEGDQWGSSVGLINPTFKSWTGTRDKFLNAYNEAINYEPPIIGIGGGGQDGDGGTGRRPIYKPIEQLGWRDSYQGFANQHSLDSPGEYKWVIEQGLSNNPLLRTAQTQFLAQSDYDVNTTDEELKNLHLANVQRGFVPETTGNPYLSFLETYTPLQGQDLINTIDSIITDINAPAGTIDQNETKRLMRQMRFGISDQAEQTQQQLVALPILEHTSPALRNEIASVLSSLHSNWMMSSDRRAGENWLEYARERDFFGMVPKDLLSK